MSYDDRSLPPKTHGDGATRVMHGTSSQGTEEERTHAHVGNTDREGPEERRSDVHG